MTINERLYAACQQLELAAEEFVAAHAELSGGHRPVLWATYTDRDEAIIVCPKDWAHRIRCLFEKTDEPIDELTFVSDDGDDS